MRRPHSPTCRALRRATVHTIRDGRRCRAPADELTLRTCGFQLFPNAPTALPPGRGGDARAMRVYTQAVQGFVRARLEDPACFDLRPGERICRVMVRTRDLQPDPESAAYVGVGFKWL